MESFYLLSYIYSSADNLLHSFACPRSVDECLPALYKAEILNGKLVTMSFFLPKLSNKKDVDQAIKLTAEKVLVLRFGRDDDAVCLQLDDILSKTSHDLSKMATIYLVDVDKVSVYTQYFDISYIPSTVFFFNGQHMKVDYGSPDHTKFVGSFKTKQDFIDLIEVIYRGAMRGKLIVRSPIDPRNIPKYDLLYQGV
ncbi:thioredoxin-like protein 4B isoform X1 [Bombina bombina]|uniref:thioredoxin-like protein 4B isoform X1 n=2 Tax=Bombina bombina TaxID=8345 RepID=UPI00235A8125|nr:thioredoxin-like protein 4B isoform X1 [Bombina bombina]